MGSAAREHQLSDSDDRWGHQPLATSALPATPPEPPPQPPCMLTTCVCLPASRESALLLPLVSGCKVPKNGEDITLACLAKGPFLDSVRVTTGPESQAQMEKTTLKTLKILDHTQVSFLSIPWKPELHYCEAIMKDNKRKLHKAIHWPGWWPPTTKEGPPGPPHTFTTGLVPEH